MPITYIVGDATQPQGSGPRIIAHVVSDSFVPWTATKKPTFARALALAYPATLQDYLWWKGSTPTMGDILTGMVKHELYVCHLLAQHGLRTVQNPRPLDYEALATCLEKLSDYAQNVGASVHMPRIGAGYAGGNWSKIEKMVEGMTRRYRTPLHVCIYDLR